MKKDMLIVVLSAFCLVTAMIILVPAQTIQATRQEAQEMKIIHSTQSWTTIIKCPPLRTTWIWNSTEGYRQISFSVTSTGNCTIHIEFLYRIDEISLTENAVEGRTYDITGPRIFIGIENSNDKPITLFFVFYMTT